MNSDKTREAEEKNVGNRTVVSEAEGCGETTECDFNAKAPRCKDAKKTGDCQPLRQAPFDKLHRRQMNADDGGGGPKAGMREDSRIWNRSRRRARRGEAWRLDESVSTQRRQGAKTQRKLGIADPSDRLRSTSLGRQAHRRQMNADDGRGAEGGKAGGFPDFEEKHAKGAKEDRKRSVWCLVFGVQGCDPRQV